MTLFGWYSFCIELKYTISISRIQFAVKIPNFIDFDAFLHRTHTHNRNKWQIWKLQTINFRFSFFERLLFYSAAVYISRIREFRYLIIIIALNHFRLSNSMKKRNLPWLRFKFTSVECVYNNFPYVFEMKSQLRALEKHFRLIGCIIYPLKIFLMNGI